ncbi:MAG: isoprenylcysteine carboxylmethyltransferase family protein [Bacteroidetes bacterium]|nr:MAG: isoprenylcysteine carboxylmethyltransferase family protein [Bacteroidota bacterium]
MNYVVLITGTIFIVLFSWFLSIRYKRYHGIARFFAFESVFILVLLNYKVWFNNPFSTLQIISWIFLILSVYVVIAGYLLLKRKGKSDTNFENTSVLVTSGIYGFIRHPLYLSIFLLGTGAMLKDVGLIQTGFGVINLIALFFTARIEEKEMIDKFGDEYLTYMKSTRMFIPFII